MEEKSPLMEPLFEKIEAYFNSSLALLKLKAIDKLATVFASLASKAITVFFLSMFLLMLNVGLAFWLGDLFGKTYYGFFCVAGFYALVGGVLCILMKQNIKQKINELIILQLLK